MRRMMTLCGLVLTGSSLIVFRTMEFLVGFNPIVLTFRWWWKTSLMGAAPFCLLIALWCVDLHEKHARALMALTLILVVVLVLPKMLKLFGLFDLFGLFAPSELAVNWYLRFVPYVVLAILTVPAVAIVGERVRMACGSSGTAVTRGRAGRARRGSGKGWRRRTRV